MRKRTHLAVASRQLTLCLRSPPHHTHIVKSKEAEQSILSALSVRRRDGQLWCNTAPWAHAGTQSLPVPQPQVLCTALSIGRRCASTSPHSSATPEERIQVRASLSQVRSALRVELFNG